MYAIGMSSVRPIYNRAWVGQSGDVIVGDYENSIFTKSDKNQLDKTCLLSHTIINLFNSLPEGAVIATSENGYVISVQTDGYEYLTEFSPEYESDEGVGSYNSEIILDMLNTDDSQSVTVNVNGIKKLLDQTSILSSKSDNTILFKLEPGQISLVDDNIDGKISVEGNVEGSYELKFKTDLIKSVMSNFDEETINMAPKHQGDVIVGIIFWTKNMSVVLGSVDE